MLFLSPAHACRVVSVYTLDEVCTSLLEIDRRPFLNVSDNVSTMSTLEEIVRKCFLFDYNHV